MECEHDSYTPTGKERHECDKESTYVFQEQKCDLCGALLEEKYLYLGTEEVKKWDSKK